MAKSHVFSKQVPMEILCAFLDTHCTNQPDAYYVVDDNLYRKIKFQDFHVSFLNELKPYYHESKQSYVTREFTYKSFTNIIRQICRSHDHPFTTKMHYNHSQYNIMYYVQKPLVLAACSRSL